MRKGVRLGAAALSVALVVAGLTGCAAEAIETFRAGGGLKTQGLP